jgi:hypothetical protein
MDEFVVKPVLGARGTGVKKIKRQEFKSCLENTNNVAEIFKEEKEYHIKNNDDVSPTYIEDSFRGGMLVQEPIKVAREFRILYFKPDTLLGYERIKSPDQFCGNLAQGAESRPIDTISFDVYIEPFRNIFKKLLDELNYPWLSIDLYVDENDNVGIFEFQMEFTYEGFDYREIRKAMQKSIEYFLPSDNQTKKT